jgi:hypothetical protein
MRIAGTLDEDLCTFMVNVSLNCFWNEKRLEKCHNENQNTYFTFNTNFSRKIVPFRRHVEKYGIKRPQMSMKNSAGALVTG